MLTYGYRAELGNAAWKVFHTMMAKFPDTPTEEDSSALKSYIFLFARLYPCGDCARHFQQILAKFPPQVGSRSSAAAWACHVHNEVNKSLKKPEFDCTKIGDFYDCGCGDDKKGSKITQTRTEPFTPLLLEKEG
jgi:FAD-linked sulfhydryl oxidase